MASTFPEVVAQLTRELNKYRNNEDHRPHYIVIGSNRQNPVTLTGEDWQPNPPFWQFKVAEMSLYQDMPPVWNVQIARAGRFRFALRRWPKETSIPINAILPKDMWCQGMSRCDTLEAVEARIRVQDNELSQPVTDTMHEAEFTLQLEAGCTTINAWFVDGNKKQWSAYYLYVERD